ncbi:hypothetical protein Plim_3152 [Planctopirus limnophila DSM 3776]|uniref:Uncharacterized protein n=1 Tax=Planctopirus limnophila (strain ATCC 43296 / DSM 3776 / IFAM 1008 / Mu 290) TaxID=521674 RepID=D5STD8_PLAL2|nr:hypothetical protein [Planctopirus limnophila]ADG68967.1 hypothetical protein Plim_3152 [Planctopirus limnophila DSM 3776]
MVGDSHAWKEKEWERYANELVSIDHGLRGGSYQRIPDRNGDCGLEGVADSGDGYQSYADQGTADADERIQKQKNKIYIDLKKLETYKDFWTAYFEDRKLTRWTLLVPKFEDKDVLKYAKKRAKETRKLNLPFIDDNFDVYVKSIEDFPAATLIVRDPRLPRGDGKPVSANKVIEFKMQEPHFVQMIDKKLKKAMPHATDTEREAYREKLLNWHLRSDNYQKGLERLYPPQWEDLQELISTTGESIESEGPLDSRMPGTRLNETRKEFAKTLEQEMPFIFQADRDIVSWGTIALWLGICPLDFPENGND